MKTIGTSRISIVRDSRKRGFSGGVVLGLLQPMLPQMLQGLSEPKLSAHSSYCEILVKFRSP